MKKIIYILISLISILPELSSGQSNDEQGFCSVFAGYAMAASKSRNSGIPADKVRQVLYAELAKLPYQPSGVRILALSRAIDYAYTSLESPDNAYKKAEIICKKEEFPIILQVELQQK